VRAEFLAAGRGGQGILLLGHIMGYAAAKFTNLYVTGTESYDAETRGGDSKIDLIFASSPEELDYFKVRHADIALFMYSEQLKKYHMLVRPGAKVFIDSTFIHSGFDKDWKVASVPYTRIAEEKLGTHVVANIVALGHIIGNTHIIPEKAVIKSIQEVVRKRWISIDLKAFEEGISLASKRKIT